MAVYIISEDGTVLPKASTVEVELSDTEVEQLLEMSDRSIAAYARDLRNAEVGSTPELM